MNQIVSISFINRVPKHMLVLVIHGIYATQCAFLGRQLFGQFLRMMCGTLAGSGKRLFVSELNVDR